MTHRLPLMPLAWGNVILHVAGLALAASFMKPGSNLAPLADRLSYLAASPIGWTIAWSVWIACAGAMVMFAIFVAARIGSRLAYIAAITAVVAAVVDVTCDWVYLFHFPQVAAKASLQTDEFVQFERMTNGISLLVANGLYCLSTLFMTLALRRFYLLGWAVFVFGMLLSAAGLFDIPKLSLWATGPTIGFYCVWVLVVARHWDRRGAMP